VGIGVLDGAEFKVAVKLKTKWRRLSLSVSQGEVYYYKV